MTPPETRVNTRRAPEARKPRARLLKSSGRSEAHVYEEIGETSARWLEA